MVVYTVEPPPGFFEVDEITQMPSAVVRVRRSQFSGLKEVDLVATSNAMPGDVLLVEKPLLEWVEDSSFFLSKAKGLTGAEEVLHHRCLAIQKLSEQKEMKQTGVFSAEVLPLLYSFCLKKDETIFSSPYEIPDSQLNTDQLKLKAAFCVLAQKGLTGTLYEKTLPDHKKLARLCVIAERTTLDTPRGKGIYKYSSYARQMVYTKPKLVSVGARPGTRKKTPEVPLPNTDYEIDENGLLILRAKRHIRFGDVLTVPKGKTFEKIESGFQLLRNKNLMKHAVLEKAKSADAPEAVKMFAKEQHPPVYSLIPKISGTPLQQRNVSRELWKETFAGNPEKMESKFLYTIDHIFNKEECNYLTGMLFKENSASYVPFHIGFETSSRKAFGNCYNETLQHLFSRCASFIPKNSSGKSLCGAANQGIFFTLTPGEEILEFSMNPSFPANTVGVAFCLCLSEGGSILFQGGKYEVPLKRGQMISWNPELLYRVPVNTHNTMSLLFSYMMYTESSTPTTSSVC